MKFSYNWLKELVDFKESPEQLAEFLTLRAFEIESVGKVGNDWALDVKLPPNRYADASGHIGLAREIAALKGIRIREAKESSRQARTVTNGKIKVFIENPDDCPRYTAALVTNIKVGESPKWMRERLGTCGLQPINNLVDAANYVMLETGQPLHIFDHAKISGEKIVVRRAQKGEVIHALDEKIYGLSSEILVIADEKEPIAIAGIKGGKESGVSADTKAVVLEAANFNPIVIRRGSQELKIKTDASIRFEHGLDPHQTEIAIGRLAALIQKIAGGDMLYQTDIYPQPAKSQKILFRPEYANRLLGLKIETPRYEKFLARLGFPFRKKKDVFLVEPPADRLDLTIEEDLIEEIARLYGHERIPSKMPEAALIPAKRNDELFWEDRVRDYLVGAGFAESLLYEFTGDQELDQFFARRDNLLELQNPTSPETAYLAPRILYKYLISAAQNLRSFEQVKIFGIGKSFVKNREPRSTKHGILEKKDLIIAAAQKGSPGEEQFYQLKGALDQLFESLGISDHWYDDAVDRRQTPRDKFHPYRFAEIKIGNEKIGYIGEIHPAVLENIKSKTRIVAAEIDFEKLWKNARSESEYAPIGKYPAVVRDIAVLVTQDTRTVEVENLIENLGGKLLVDTDLFDYFQDDTMRGNEEKSLAFHLIFQSPKRTLRDEEVDAAVQKIIQALEERGWEVRK